MTAHEIKETAQRFFKNAQYAEAIPLLKSAAESFPNDESLWKELVSAASQSGQRETAVEFAKRGIRNHPRSDWLWRQLGNDLTTLNRFDEAENALNNSRTLNSNAEWLWRYFATLHRKRKNPEMEIDALEFLNSLGRANATDLYQLGIAYHYQKTFRKALEYYRLSAATHPEISPLFSMGLVYNDPDVSQDADAADAYHRILVLKPDCEQARRQLEATKKKLIPLAENARVEAAELVQREEYFRFYLNPFEALAVGVEQRGHIFTVDATGSTKLGLPPKPGEDAACELDLKIVQRAKKRLLQEIDLNDGKVSWLENHPLDKSQALALEDELHDKLKRAHHWAIYENKRLLRFLTRGEIDHFLLGRDSSTPAGPEH